MIAAKQRTRWEEAEALRAAGLTVKEIAQEMGIRYDDAANHLLLARTNRMREAVPVPLAVWQRRAAAMVDHYDDTVRQAWMRDRWEAWFKEREERG